MSDLQLNNYLTIKKAINQKNNYNQHITSFISINDLIKVQINKFMFGESYFVRGDVGDNVNPNSYINTGTTRENIAG